MWQRRKWIKTNIKKTQNYIVKCVIKQISKNDYNGKCKICFYFNRNIVLNLL